MALACTTCESIILSLSSPPATDVGENELEFDESAEEEKN